MHYILLGSFAFVLFVLYDINSVAFHFKWMHGSFMLGCFILCAATAGVVAVSVDTTAVNILRLCFGGGVSLLFLLLLAYTLFFALPFEETYVESKTASGICRDGVYALCRHPGVLWFTGFFFSLWAALGKPLLLAAALTFSLLNVLYVVFQDNWTFIKIFAEYDVYKKSTPFLFPTLRSIRCCFQTLRLKGR